MNEMEKICPQRTDTFILIPFANFTVPGDIAPHIKTVPQTKPCSLFELQLISTLDTILLYKSAATWLQALEGVVDEPTEHVSLVLLHLDQFLQ